jgi:hypothetical protein
LDAKIEFLGGLLYEGEVTRRKGDIYKIEGTGRLKFANGSSYSG